MVLAVYVSFLACLIVCGLLVANAFKVSRARQIAACQRGNIVRAEDNLRAVNQGLQRDILKEFLAGAVIARTKEGDLVTAAKYRQLGEQLEHVEYHTIALVDCAAVIDATK